MSASPGILLPRILAGLLPLLAAAAFAADADLRELREQNRALAEQVRAQQRQIDDLRRRLDGLDTPAGAAGESAPAPAGAPRLRLSGEAAIGYFDSNSEGTQPNAEFRVDEARVFIEAAVWRNVYLFGGLELTTRESTDENFHLGELYIDVEELWRGDRDHTLSLRAGRMNLPFGEEYQVRNVVDNPLVTHSLMDIWGIDEGVQVYGSLGRFRYNLAVMNGGHRQTRDFKADKAVVARVAFAPTTRLSLSASAMRTGDLAVTGDGLSEAWFANAFFRPLGLAATTKNFWADLVELDATYRWRQGHLRGTVGWVDFDDDSTAADNSRHLTYWGIEGVQNLGDRLYAAARYSTIDAPRGYPLTGLANSGEYFYNPFAPLTRDLQRMSFGLGYRFGAPVVWKIEYSTETGHLQNGTERDATHLLSSLLGIRF